MATLTYNDYLNDLLNSNILRQRVKLEVLRFQDLSTISEITGDLVNDSGTLNVVKANGLRKTCSFTLINSTITQTAKYIPNISNGILGVRQPFRLWLGLENDNGDTYFIPQGIFFMDDPMVVSNFSESVVNINCSDAFALFNGTLGGTLNNTYIINSGTNLYNVMQSLLDNENYPLPPLLDPTYLNYTTPYTITKDPSSTIGDLMVELAAMVSANIFFNENAQLVVEQDYDDSIKPSVYDFTTNEAHYQGADQTHLYSKFYNSVQVVGSNINNTSTVSATATNTNISSPISVQNLGFTKTKLITDNNITTTDLCQARANYELKYLMAVQSSAKVKSIPLYHLQPNQIITITDENLGLTKQRFLINGFSIPFNVGGVMSLDVVSATDLSFT